MLKITDYLEPDRIAKRFSIRSFKCIQYLQVDGNMKGKKLHHFAVGAIYEGKCVNETAELGIRSEEARAGMHCWKKL